jgi:CheY-like chemotaxis protein
MASHRILIVDDQHETRRMLRSGLETLGPEFSIVDVPSAEEAIFLISYQDFDLLVADVRLPGISGLELMRRIRNQNPELKVILVTGIVDPDLRKQVALAGADAFFIKPIELADFLDTVERCLSLDGSSIPDPSLIEEEEPTENVSERLARMRKELDAFSAILLDDSGKILARAGDLPVDAADSTLIPSLMAVFSASAKVTNVLEMNPPDDLFYFAGNHYSIFFTHIGETYALFVAVDPLGASDQIGGISQIIKAAAQDILSNLAQIGVPLETGKLPPLPVREPEEDLPIRVGESPALESIFHQVAGKVLKTDEVDAFWDSAVDDEAEESVVSADVISYEQARQLGLAPNEDEE